MKITLNSIIVAVQLFVSLPVFAEDKWVSVEPAMRKVTITGFTRARSKMPLISEVSGKVKKIYADIGEPVPASKKFACLDDTFVQIDIKSAQSEISQHNIEVNYFKKEVLRHEKLVKKQTSAVSVLDGLVRDLGNARNALSRAVINKQRLEELKRRHCIEAPVGWLVIDRDIELGQWVNEGQVLAHVGNYSQLTVPVTLSQQELSSLKNNQNAIELSFPEVNIKVPTRIEHISPAFDEKTRKTQVDLLINDLPQVVHGGMRVGLTLDLPDSKSSSFNILKVALEERFEEYWLERKDGKRIRVQLLNDLGNGKVNIASKDIKMGDQFKVVKH